jgi:hypothetical protein
MTDSINPLEQAKTASGQWEDQTWAAYNDKMASLFAERNTHPVDSVERSAVARRILSLWVAEGD